MGIEVEELSPLPENVSLTSAVEEVLSRIPSHLTVNVKNIKVGNFEHLNKREMQAVYENSVIYVTNKQESVSDLVDDLVHEFAHSVEEIYGEEIYGDKTLQDEFLRKRKKMWNRLKSGGYEVDISFFLETSYNKDFDNFLYKEVGYDKIRMMLADIFFSPYAATSLKEYYANGFEAFFMKEEVRRLRDISPVLYKKIIILMDKENEF